MRGQVTQAPQGAWLALTLAAGEGVIVNGAELLARSGAVTESAAPELGVWWPERLAALTHATRRLRAEASATLHLAPRLPGAILTHEDLATARWLCRDALFALAETPLASEAAAVPELLRADFIPRPVAPFWLAAAGAVTRLPVAGTKRLVRDTLLAVAGELDVAQSEDSAGEPAWLCVRGVGTLWVQELAPRHLAKSLALLA